VRLDRDPSSLRLALGGPEEVEGVLQALSPQPRAVHLDGRRLSESSTGLETYRYDPSSRVLYLHYSHARTHELVVEC